MHISDSIYNHQLKYAKLMNLLVQKYSDHFPLKFVASLLRVSLKTIKYHRRKGCPIVSPEACPDNKYIYLDFCHFHLLPKTIDVEAYCLASLIESYSMKTGYCYMSMDKMGEVLNLNSKTVSKKIIKLKESGLIDVITKEKSYCKITYNFKVTEEWSETKKHAKIKDILALLSDPPEKDDMSLEPEKDEMLIEPEKDEPETNHEILSFDKEESQIDWEEKFETLNKLWMKYHHHMSDVRGMGDFNKNIKYRFKDNEFEYERFIPILYSCALKLFKRPDLWFNLRQLISDINQKRGIFGDKAKVNNILVNNNKVILEKEKEIINPEPTNDEELLPEEEYTESYNK